MDADRRVALVHDYLLVMRGAERTFAVIAADWPDAPVYTLLYDAKTMREAMGGREIHTSWLQRLRVGQNHFRALLPLFPSAAERMNLQGYDLVISSSSAFAHGIPVDDGAHHVCYCHTPFRYAWHDYIRATEGVPTPVRPFVRSSLNRMRRWDRAAAQRVTSYIANSELSRQRIEEFWDRDATVVYPPVEVDRFAIGEPQEYFLVVAELVRHKRIELALEAAVHAGQQIKVVGSGPELKRLSALYGSTAEFLGRVSDDELPALYAGARALVVPNIEEFGIAAVEAQAAGRPVIAASVGGASATVVNDETGVLVTPENVGSLAEAMTQVDFDRFSPERIREHALQFSPAAFRRAFLAELSRVTGTTYE